MIGRGQRETMGSISDCGGGTTFSGETVELWFLLRSFMKVVVFYFFFFFLFFLAGGI